MLGLVQSTSTVEVDLDPNTGDALIVNTEQSWLMAGVCWRLFVAVQQLLTPLFSTEHEMPDLIQACFCIAGEII